MQGYGIMGRRKIQRIGFGLLMVGVVLLAGTLTAPAVVGTNGDAKEAGRADILVIDGLKAFGSLERPVVYFYHGKHTDALAKENKDCSACHLKDKEQLSLKFKRLENPDKETVMAVYHENCIVCHKETKQAGKASGPETCGECHVEEAAPVINRRPLALDKSLHYRHVKAMDKKCEQCHHAYNEQTKKLFYDKGKEGACLYCHKTVTEENRISGRLASHQACVGCHQQKTAAKLDAGPVNCIGCHEPGRQAMIQKLADVPRLERNQPDTVLVKSLGKDDLPANPPDRMNRVPFDHKAHEGYNDSCRACHHADLQSCVGCHTLGGTKDGKQVKLAQAMHQKDTAMSCIGCHNEQKKQAQCIGCHHSIPADRTLASEMSCQTCHIPSELENNTAMDDNQSKAAAAELLAARTPVRNMIPVDQIPETVTLKKLADEFESVTLPHRKIVLKLAEVNTTSKLAAYYHKDPMTLCRGCHHNSPASTKPPQCASCHGKSSEALNLTRPGLMAAYHQQCFECHQTMGIEKPASRECTACHAKRK